MCGEAAVVYQITVFRNFADTFAANEKGILSSTHVSGANLFRLGVVNGAIGDVKTDVAIDAHVAFSQDFVRFRIVLSKIGVNIRISDMDGDVVPRCGQPSLIVGLPCRGDLNWSAFRRFDLSLGNTDRQNQRKEQTDRCSHGGRRR